MKLILMAVVALALLGGGGAGAYFYFSGSTAEAALTEEEILEKERRERDEALAAKKENSEAFEFVELDPLILPIVDRNGVSQVVSLVVTLEVYDAASAKKAEKIMPKLKDAYIQDLYGAFNKHAALKGGVIQVSTLKKRLQKISHKVMGSDEYVNAVLLQVVQQRPI